MTDEGCSARLPPTNPLVLPYKTPSRPPSCSSEGQRCRCLVMLLNKRQATKKDDLWNHGEELLWGSKDSVMMMLKKRSFVLSGSLGNFYSDYRSIIYRIIAGKCLIMKQILNLVWHCHFTPHYLMRDLQSNKYLFCQDIKALWEVPANATNSYLRFSFLHWIPRCPRCLFRKKRSYLRKPYRKVCDCIRW